MGSRPTRVRSVEIQPEGVNGSEAKVTINELKTENTRLKNRLSDLEKLNPDDLIKENDRLKKQNEDLRNELIKIRESSVVDIKRSISFPVNKGSDLTADNAYKNDMLSDNNMNLTPSPSIDRRILSDRSSSPGYSSCKTSPNVNDGRKRKIDPNSVLQRMSDIDAYGQGLPLADSSLMVKNVRRTRHRKRRTTQNTKVKDDSQSNSEGTTSPAEILPKSSEEGHTDSGVHSTDVEQHVPDQRQHLNDIQLV
nr:uncharacterized protein LOC129281846 [Lytechinus pictus]